MTEEAKVSTQQDSGKYVLGEEQSRQVLLQYAHVGCLCPA